MSRKFGHEKLNRQEKTWREPCGCAGGKESPGLWEFVITPDHHVRLRLNQTVARRLHKVELMEAFRKEVGLMRFIVSGYKFMFSYRVRAFAEANGLTLEAAAHQFDRIREEAEEKLRIVIGKVRKTIETNFERDDAGNLVEVLTLNYDELSRFLEIDTAT